MTSVYFYLLGGFHTVWDGRTIHPIDSNKARELLCYLLLYRKRAHPREFLAGMLWGDLTTAQSRTYLRKALWQVQTAFEAIARDFLVVDTEWVRINPQIELWLDTAVLEETFQRVEGLDGEHLDVPTACAVREAVEIYAGDLLEGWYQDWCLYERERLQNVYLALLDKLMGYCEVHRCCEQGLSYGSRALRYDRAREQTHRRMMRLYYIAGDRTAALRQYEHCSAALGEEFNLEPTDTTC